jgi:hypothetical protein
LTTTALAERSCGCESFEGCRAGHPSTIHISNSFRLVIAPITGVVAPRSKCVPSQPQGRLLKTLMLDESSPSSPPSHRDSAIISTLGRSSVSNEQLVRMIAWVKHNSNSLGGRKANKALSSCKPNRRVVFEHTRIRAPNTEQDKESTSTRFAAPAQARETTSELLPPYRFPSLLHTASSSLYSEHQAESTYLLSPPPPIPFLLRPPPDLSPGGCVIVPGPPPPVVAKMSLAVVGSSPNRPFITRWGEHFSKSLVESEACTWWQEDGFDGRGRDCELMRHVRFPLSSLVFALLRLQTFHPTRSFFALRSTGHQ